MGLFSKIKENLHHGGVKLELDAPGSVSLNDAQLPVTVTLTASEPATIKSVTAELYATPNNMSFNAQGMNQSQVGRQQTERRIVARTHIDQGFTMAAGETKTLQVNIVMNAGANAAQNGANPAAASVLKVASTLESLSSMANPGSYRYTLNASANVDGIALDPSKSHQISVNGPGQFGSTTNIQI